MNYTQTLEFLFQSLPAFETKGATAYKPGLERITAFCRHIGNPQRNFFTIHVAGTNGKGSVSHIIASVLQQAGYRTGLFTSPPLQSYFRLNAPGAGQFEHTLIIVDEGASLHFIEGCSAPKYNVANLHAGCVELFVGKNAKLRYSTIENWSKNMYNLNTKRARVDEDGDIEWISGSFGSHVGYLYPMSVLNGRRARSSFTGITFAGAGQNLDTGCKVVLNAPETSATVETKGISKSGGIQTFRSSIVATPKAEGSKATVSCQSLMLDDQSRSDTIPAMDIRAKNVDIGHEATIGRIGDDKVFYLMSRGISEEEARTMIVNGFANPVSKELPLEYAVEMNNLIKLEMEGAIG